MDGITQQPVLGFQRHFQERYSGSLPKSALTFKLGDFSTLKKNI